MADYRLGQMVVVTKANGTEVNGWVVGLEPVRVHLLERPSATVTPSADRVRPAFEDNVDPFARCEDD